ncbi:MAG: amino acid ABC transporter substrate-binding protein [Lachnospiraceae bacterium]
MKRKIALLMVGAMMAMTLFAGCGSKKETTEDNSQDTTTTEDSADSGTERTKFIVGFDANFPPYGYEEDGEYVGFDLDLAQEVCDRNGWELEKQPIDWDSKDMELDSGTIDCIWNGFTINGREDEYTWTEPYVDNSQVMVVPEDAGIATLDDLAGKQVLVQADSSALKALQSDQKALAETFTLTEVADYNTAFMTMESGAADAVAMDIGVADYQIESRGGGYAILEEEIAAEQYGVGFKLGNEELRDQVQDTLNEMAQDGKLTEIAEKWELTDAVCLGK